MTISEVIAKISKTKPHPFEDDTIISFINTLDQQVQSEVLRTAVADRVDYTWQNNGDTELLMPAPYDSCYLFYAAARIDFDTKEFESYNQNMVQFNNLYEEYKRWYKGQETTDTIRIKNFW